MLTQEQLLEELSPLAIPKVKIQSAKDNCFFTFNEANSSTSFTYSENEELVTKPCTIFAIIKACRSFSLSEGYARKIPPNKHNYLVGLLNYHLEETRKNLFAFIDDQVRAFTSDVHADHYPQETVPIIHDYLTTNNIPIKGYVAYQTDLDAVLYGIVLDKPFQVKDDTWFPMIYIRDSLLGNIKFRVSPAFVRESDKAQIISVRTQAVSIRKDGTGYSIPFEEYVRLGIDNALHEINYESSKLNESLTSEATSHIGVFVRQVLKEMPIPRDSANEVLADVDNAENMYQVIEAFAKGAVSEEDVIKSERMAMLAGRVMVHRDICRHCHQEYTTQEEER